MTEAPSVRTSTATATSAGNEGRMNTRASNRISGWINGNPPARRYRKPVATAAADHHMAFFRLRRAMNGMNPTDTTSRMMRAFRPVELSTCVCAGASSEASVDVPPSAGTSALLPFSADGSTKTRLTARTRAKLVEIASIQANSGGMAKRNGVLGCMPKAYTTALALDTATAHSHDTQAHPAGAHFHDGGRYERESGQRRNRERRREVR